MKERNHVLDEALRLQSMGISVIPIGNKKKPAVKTWKKFQTTPADARQIHDWFDLRDDLGLGIILGPVSGNLVARDFDLSSSFHQWSKSNPNLAKKLPTVKSSRGFHVYARIPHCPFQEFGDGELRSHRHFIVAPPSLHPDGCMYSWNRRFEKLDDVPVLSLEHSGFGKAWKNDGPKNPDEKKQIAVTTDRTEIDSVVSVLSVEETARLLEGTIPQTFGTRRKSLFMLARRIRGHSKLGNTPLPDLKATLRVWHQRALPTIRTKGFDESWTDFVDAWGNVDLNRCGDAVLEAMRRTDATELPRKAMEYEGTTTRRLIGLCAELARCSANGVFYLSCRKAAEAMKEADFALISRMLKMLCADGVLLEVEHGGPHSNRASRYRFLHENE